LAVAPSSDDGQQVSATIYSGRDLERAEGFPFLGGRIAAFTRSAPNKESGNEDALGLVPVDPQSGVRVVADGVGGLPTGGVAARLTIESLVMQIAQVGEDYAMRAAILDGIERANQQILDLKTGAAATVAVIEIDGRTVRPYHVGDSLILVCGQRGKIKLQNIPHSPVGYAVESGLLDEDAAVHHEERNVVSNVVGDAEMRIEIGPVTRLAPRDTLLLASDGVSDNLYLEEIVDSIRTGPLERVAERLVGACLSRMRAPREDKPGHPDDLTFVAFRPAVPRRRARSAPDRPDTP
jgi:serine/threonine protein phosphatase PrpC